MHSISAPSRGLYSKKELCQVLGLLLEIYFKLFDQLVYHYQKEFLLTLQTWYTYFYLGSNYIIYFGFKRDV